MNKEAKTGFDLGFFIFLGIAAVFLIPIALGIQSIDKIFLIGKIVLVVIGVSAIILFGTLLYLRIRRKKREKDTVKTETTANEEGREKEEGVVKKEIRKETEEELVVIEKEFIDEIVEPQKGKQEALSLKMINQKYDL